jgi:serine phosphatase RsbU (regulator of sigma subunit)/anti-sigma regulatory factor (Ser/Thr protein kinase)
VLLGSPADLFGVAPLADPLRGRAAPRRSGLETPAMNDIAGHRTSDQNPPGLPAPDVTARQALLAAALREAVEKLTAVTGLVYLLEPDDTKLVAEMIAGTPPEMFTLPERMSVDAPYASSTAWRTGKLVVFGEPMVQADHPGLARLVPFPYSVVSTPLAADGYRFGVLSVVRIPSENGVLDDEQRQWLCEEGDRLATRLTPLARQGVSMRPGPRPLLVPVFRAEPPLTSLAASWSLPDVPGSAGLTMLYHMYKLGTALNEAAGTREVSMAARSHIMDPSSAQSLVLGVVSDRRLWVVGHHGPSAKVVRRLHGSGVESGTPATDTLCGREPLLFPDRALLLDVYPDAPDDGQQAWAYLPLAASGRTIGVCCLGFAEEHQFEAKEEAMLMMMAHMLGPALERAQLGENERTLAESLQKRLLPRILSDSPDMITTARYLPASATAGVGGDWYDVITLPAGQIGLVVGDVEGHNVDSSVIMGQLRCAVLAYASEDHRPTAVLARTSQLLAKLDTELMATCCFVRVDLADGTMEVALAGHPAPLVRQPDGRISTLEAPANVPLGISTAPYQSVEATLEPDALLLLHTNGFTYSHPHQGIADMPGLFAKCAQDADYNLEELADRLISMVPDATERRDDVVVLLAQYEGAAREPHHHVNRMEIQRHDLHGVRATRKFIRDSLRAWGLDTVADELELMASEIVTNALIHADSHVDLRLREYPDRVRMEVRDSDASPPVPSAISAAEEEKAQSEHGRGLIIVEALASAWGTSPSGRGKTVWLEIPAPSAHEEPNTAEPAG